MVTESINVFKAVMIMHIINLPFQVLYFTYILEVSLTQLLYISLVKHDNEGANTSKEWKKKSKLKIDRYWANWAWEKSA